jgi:outer membrane receptor protein involved in Fe transport
MTRFRSFAVLASASLIALSLLRPAGLSAQGAGPTGTIAGRVIDEDGNGVASAQVFIDRPALSTQTRGDGNYTLTRVPPGTYMVHVRELGFRPESTSVDVPSSGQATQNFTLRHDPLQLQTMVVTGTQTPRMNLDASVAVTTLTSSEIQAAAPRSTTEMLRFVPGFTRVESSGGEVNENISMRGILGVEYVAFLEDGLPVFPTMHTFFMNADNLFRFDNNIERMEVVRGGSSPLFGSNTPGAIVNFINKSGGDIFGGTMTAQAGTMGLARYDLNMNGPVGDDWRFSVGGFYRYDHGVRDPGFPGISGGQLKANITRELDNGYIRISAKYLNDRNQFVLDLPFTDASNPTYVPGFSDYGSMNTNEGLDQRVPTPTGDLTFPLDNGLRTEAVWFTADVSLDLSDNWHLQNAAQVMNNAQQWNALLPFNTFTAADYLTAPAGQGGLGLPAGTAATYVFTNHFDANGVTKSLFDTPNGLVSPGGLWHVEKPLSAIQDQLTLRRTFGKHSLNLGAYLANYSQDNKWYFSNILMDVRNNPRFLDLVVNGDTVTKNGFRNYLDNYVNGHGYTSVISGVIGGELQLTQRLRADLGLRGEYDDFVQASENTARVDLDADSTTKFDNELFGNGSFRHFTRSISDWSASVGLNYRLNDQFSLYSNASRGYKMPALDEFLNAAAQEQVNLFDSREIQAVEGGVKFANRNIGVTVNGFWTKLKNVVSQGSVVDSITGATTWIVVPSPENKSYGAEVEAFISPIDGLMLQGNTTILKAELGAGAGADIGSRLNGVPTSLGNLAAIYAPRRASGLSLKADWHYVADRPVDLSAGISLPAYNYFNFGAGFIIPGSGTRVNVDLLNAFQSKGLEEGNPRIQVGGASALFNARPLLPRRLQASIQYDFGGGPPPEAR